MITKEKLKTEYQQLYCELGFNHPDTKMAKRLYDIYCLAEQKALDTFKEFLNSLQDTGIVVDTEEWYNQFKRTLED